ncbi:unnamed protein product [Adineta ricciae]|nr:unnamed protein product [Adineta ricciae]
MVLSATLGTQENFSGLPDDIFDYNHQIFYEFVQQKYGVKLAIDNLIDLLKLKVEQQRKKKRSSKRSSKQHSSAHSSTKSAEREPATQKDLLLTQPLDFHDLSFSNAATTQPSDLHNQSIAPSYLSSQKERLDELGHLADIERRLDKWWKSISDANSCLQSGTDYFVEINKSTDTTFTSVLTCHCNTKFKLPYTEAHFFKLSTFCRHFKEKHFAKFNKRKHFKRNDNYVYSSTEQSETFDDISQTSFIELEDANSERTSPSSKRVRSHSISATRPAKKK